MLPGITKALIDRMNVIITYNETEHLFGVPKLPSRIGRSQAIAVYGTLEEYGLIDNVQASCYDTTSPNTGRLKMTCILLEQNFGRAILYLLCRRHVYELVLRAIFELKNNIIFRSKLVSF